MAWAVNALADENQQGNQNRRSACCVGRRWAQQQLKGRAEREKAAVYEVKDKRVLAKPDRKAGKHYRGHFSQELEEKVFSMTEKDANGSPLSLLLVLAYGALAFPWCWFCRDPRESSFYPVCKHVLYDHASLGTFYVCVKLCPIGSESAGEFL